MTGGYPHDFGKLGNLRPTRSAGAACACSSGIILLSVSDSHWSHWSCAEKCAGPLSSFDPSRLVKLTMDHPEEIAMVK